MIKTTHLSKTYKNGYNAVNGLDLDIQKGDIYGFLGPNGSGKTTTIRMLTGIIDPTEGLVDIDGYSPSTDKEQIQRMIGVLPESHGYYPWMTAYEYLDYFYHLFDPKDKDSQAKINYLLDKVGLKSRAHDKIAHFSRGMKQRLGIAKTLINSPQIIFLDEPTLGLDPAGQKDMIRLIVELNQSMGITIFVTSHLLKDIEILCNKVAIIKNGYLLAQDQVSNLQKRYAKGTSFQLSTSDDSQAIALIKDISGISEILQDQDLFHVKVSKTKNADLVKRRIVETLFLAKLDIFEIKEEKMTIEDIYLELVHDTPTKEEIRA